MVGIISFFLLFTVIEQDNELDIFSIWGKTIYIYFIFLLMTKSKWYFSVPVLLLLIVDQSLKFQIKFEEKRKEGKEDKENESTATIVRYENIRNKLEGCIIALIVIGFLHYTIRQYNEFGSKFSLVKLILYHSCRSDK
jgi:hypothetical protein